MDCSLARATTFHQVSWKSNQQFFGNRQTNKLSLVEVSRQSGKKETQHNRAAEKEMKSKIDIYLYKSGKL